MTPTLTPPVRGVEERNALIEQWSGLVPFVLRRLRDDPLVARYRDDCRSAAHLILVRAAELWREDGGAKFSTYALHWMRRSVLRVAAQEARRRRREVPFSAMYRDEDDRPFDPASKTPRRRPDPKGLDQLPGALARLTRRHRFIIEAHYGLNGSEPRTLRELAASLGCSRPHAYETFHEALRRLMGILNPHRPQAEDTSPANGQEEPSHPDHRPLTRQETADMATLTSRPGTTNGAHDPTPAAIAALREELRQLRRAVRRLQRTPVQIIVGTPPPRQPVAPVQQPAPGAGEKGRTISPVIGDILKVLEEAGQPLTGTRLLEAMSRRGMEWSARSVAQHLAEMVRDGTLENPDGVTPRGYRLPAPPPA